MSFSRGNKIPIPFWRPIFSNVNFSDDASNKKKYVSLWDSMSKVYKDNRALLPDYDGGSGAGNLLLC